MPCKDSQHDPDDAVHVVLIGTKPDIIKQGPVYHELKGRGHRTLLCHTGQHFDTNLSDANLTAFDLKPDVNLDVRGNMSGLAAGITAQVSAYLDHVASSGLAPILYVHGDTTTAMAGAVGTFSAGHGLVHVEAGLRTLSPKREVLTEWIEGMRTDSIDWETYADQTAARASYERGSREPSPEQFNTRVADAGSHLHAAPTELNREYLIDEGYAPQSIDVVSNSVVDAVEQFLDHADARELFETYPQLENGEFIRFCVHRRENTTDETRFRALMSSMEHLLERPPHPVHPAARHRVRDQTVRHGRVARGARGALRRAVHHQPGVGQLRPRRPGHAALRGDRDRLRQHPGGGEHPRGAVRDPSVRVRPW